MSWTRGMVIGVLTLERANMMPDTTTGKLKKVVLGFKVNPITGKLERAMPIEYVTH